MSDKPKLMSTTARIRIQPAKLDLMNTPIDHNNREVMAKLFEWLREGKSSFLDMGEDNAPLPEISFELTPERQQWLAERGVFTEQPTKEQQEAMTAKGIIPRPLSDDGSGEVSVLRSLGLAMGEAYKKIPENPEHDDNILRLDAVKKCLQGDMQFGGFFDTNGPDSKLTSTVSFAFPGFHNSKQGIISESDYPSGTQFPELLLQAINLPSMQRLVANSIQSNGNLRKRD
jgi:hypothetical protein